MTEHAPDTFDVYVWGKALSRVVASLRGRAELGRAFRVHEGVAGACVTFLLGEPRTATLAILDVLERHRKEGGVELGANPDEPLPLPELVKACDAARRVKGLPYELAKPESTVDESSGTVDFLSPGGPFDPTDF